MNIKPYAKSVLAALVTIGYALQAAISDGSLSGAEIGGLIGLALTTIGVYAVPNKPADGGLGDTGRV